MTSGNERNHSIYYTSLAVIIECRYKHASYCTSIQNVTHTQIFELTKGINSLNGRYSFNIWNDNEFVLHNIQRWENTNLTTLAIFLL